MPKDATSGQSRAQRIAPVAAVLISTLSLGAAVWTAVHTSRKDAAQVSVDTHALSYASTGGSFQEGAQTSSCGVYQLTVTVVNSGFRRVGITAVVLITEHGKRYTLSRGRKPPSGFPSKRPMPSYAGPKLPHYLDPGDQTELKIDVLRATLFRTQFGGDVRDDPFGEVQVQTNLTPPRTSVLPRGGLEAVRPSTRICAPFR